MLVTIECRRRTNIQDVTWIEQLVTKKHAIGADHTIAVSASGFSENAQKIADQNGISLRIISDVGIEDINALQRLDFVVFRSEAHTSELPSLMRSSYAAFRSQKKT